MKKIFIILFAALLSSLPSVSKSKVKKMSYSVDCIWKTDAYCAFTSLIKYKGKYYCSFREGESHVFDSQGKAEGRTRILQSKDGKRWRSVFLGSKSGIDLRDPKLSVMPDDMSATTVMMQRVLRSMSVLFQFSPNRTSSL